MIARWIEIVYILILSALAIYGCLGLMTLALYWRHRRNQYPCPTVADSDLPSVTVQLPVYNERYVIKRLIDAAVNLDYPHDRLQIQVIDDSTDETTSLAAQLVADYQRQGIDIELRHRTVRGGYKAGALAEALPHASGDFVALFDADFCPNPDFLRQTAPHFVNAPQLGMIQARWDHLNAAESPLTAMQAIALDKHFAMEQTVRHRADLFPKFNGSGGIWRRACLEDAGGWQSDTICEDLCLSTRAILRGWQFRFLADVVAPAELPNTMSAYKNQQARWAKGSLQCLIKYFWSILRDRNHSLVARVYAILTMLGYTTHFLVLTLLLLQLPMMLLNVELSPRLIFFSIAGLGQPVLFVLAQHVLYDDWLKRLRHFPATLIIAIGMGVSQCRAILEVVFGRIRPIKHPFVRTPKGEEGQTAYLLPFDRIIYVELLLAVYAFVGLIVAIYTGHFTSLVLLSACLLGFGYVGLQSLAERRR